MTLPVPAQILLVDRDPKTGRELATFLRKAGHAVERVGESEKAYNLLDSRPFNALLLDLHAGPLDAMRLLAVARERTPDICVILLVDEPQTALATAAMKQGVHDFQTKPLNLDKIEAVLQQGLERQRLLLETVALKRRLDERFGLAALTGHSRLMAYTYNAVRQAGPTDLPILIAGEPGAGKEVVAQALHHASPRRDEPFVKFDCRTLPPATVEQELFGDVEIPLKGRFELADGGTLYLESVEDLPLAAQRRILTLLKEKRLPGNETSPTGLAIDTRLICAAHASLDTLAASGALLPEFLRHAGQVVIEVPPLRRRIEDLPLLTAHILEKLGARAKGIAVAREVLDAFEAYDWPGNVRELETILAGMIATAPEGATVGVNDLPIHLRHAPATTPEELRFPIGAPLDTLERAAIEATLTHCGGDKAKCAKTLGIGLRTLYRKLDGYVGK